MLAIWLNMSGVDATLKTQPSGYDLVLVTERKECLQSDAECMMRKWLRHCYAPPEYASRRMEKGAHTLVEDVYQAEKFPASDNVKVRRGDFGEALAHFVLQKHPSFGIWLPVYRLRQKEDREKPLFGYDLVGFTLAVGDDSSNVLWIAEAKLRSSRDDGVIPRGHNKLASYSRAREVEHIGRVAQWLFDEGRADEADSLARFGDAWAQEEFERRHVFVGVFDELLSLDKMLEAMNTKHCALSAFTVCAVVIARLRNRVEAAYAP